MFCMLKKVYLAYVSKHSQIVKNKFFFKDFKREKLWHYLAVKKLSVLLRGITSKHYGYFFVGIICIPLEQKTNLNRIKEYVKIKIFIM